jgi:cysteinyl-tRNA synthetase
MTLKIYNTLTSRYDEIIPCGNPMEKIEDYPPVSIYSCGPTVYDYAHIGNFRTYVLNDLLRRYLKFRGYKVIHAMNITDVEDKIIARSSAAGVPVEEYTSKYTDLFFEDCRTMNIEPAEHVPRATESIPEMVDIIKRLDSRGLVYIKDGSVYFSIAKFSEYGKLSRLDCREIKSGARYDADEYGKDDVRDFALWKAAKENEIRWDTPYGAGRPGWHIECSAMIRKIFGTTIDIHTGGVDLIFPHHENEIAQSEGAFGEKFVRHWIHWEHLLVEGTKMSKSKGNFYTLRDLVEKGHSPRAIRYLLLSAHYRKQLNFTLDGLAQAGAALDRIDNCLARLDEKAGASQSGNPDAMIGRFFGQFTEAADDDLNIARGLGIFFDFLREINAGLDKNQFSRGDKKLIMDALRRIDSVLGFIFMARPASDIDKDRIDTLVAERISAKKNRDFKRADEIRDSLAAEGIALEDTRDGTRWKKTN